MGFEPLPKQRWRVLGNYLAAVTLLVIGYTFYCLIPWLKGPFATACRHCGFLGDSLYWATPDYSKDVLGRAGYEAIDVAVRVFVLVLPLYYLTIPRGHAVKCRLFWRAVYARLVGQPGTPQERVAVLAVAVKAFFLPLMIAWLAKVGESLPWDWDRMTASPGRFFFLYIFLLNTCTAIDLICFTIGYSVEHPRLNNEIRSVEPTFIGWLVALLCYPPLNGISGRLIGSQHATPTIQDPAIEMALLCFMLALWMVYTWASVALGLRASNLTNRGIVQKGPYAIIRHPAYAAKNLFWWCSVGPALILSGADLAAVFAAVISWTALSGLYWLRALTEERHLLADPDYVEYCRRVRYRFVPGIY